MLTDLCFNPDSADASLYSQKLFMPPTFSSPIEDTKAFWLLVKYDPEMLPFIELWSKLNPEEHFPELGDIPSDVSATFGSSCSQT